MLNLVIQIAQKTIRLSFRRVLGYGKSVKGGRMFV
jgi:hypothetical protein